MTPVTLNKKPEKTRRKRNQLGDRQVLLVNNSEEVVNIISWQKAIKILFSEKAFKPFDYEFYHKIVTNHGHYDLPTALILTEFANIPYKPAALSRRNIMKRDNNTCQYCGIHIQGENQTIDHVVPRSRGGPHAWKNVAASCKRCNSRKADRTPEEAQMKLTRLPFAPTKKVLVYTQALAHNTKHPEWSRWLGNEG
jgi:hypothetical protein